MSRWSLGWGHRQASWILTGMNKRLFQSYPTWKCPVQGHHRRNTFFYPFSVFDSGSLTIKPWASHRHSYLASAKETCEHLYLGISTFFSFCFLWSAFSPGKNKLMILCIGEQVDVASVMEKSGWTICFVPSSHLLWSWDTVFVPSPPSDKSGFCPSVLLMTCWP